jgi:hypothetical protein
VATAEPGGQERAAFIESIEALLRPLMPLLLNYGVTYADVQEVLRTLYVESMGARIRAQGRPSTPARLALMAGLNVGEVEKLTKSREERLTIKASNVQRVDEITRILSIWHDDPRFSTPYGAPLDLSLKQEKGFRHFEDLIAVACPDSDKDLILDELVASGSIQVHDNKFIRCVSRTFLPTVADVSRISRFGRQASALNTTLAHNLLRDSEEPAYFERDALCESRVSVGYRDEALRFLAVEGQSFLDKFDRWGIERETIYEDASGKRYGVCLFFHEESVVDDSLIQPSPSEESASKEPSASDQSSRSLS